MPEGDRWDERPRLLTLSGLMRRMQDPEAWTSSCGSRYATALSGSFAEFAKSSGKEPERPLLCELA